MNSFSAQDIIAFDPQNAEDCESTLGNVIAFMNAERAQMGHAPVKCFLILGLDKPYDEIVQKGTDA